MDIKTPKKLAGINEFQGYTEYKVDENQVNSSGT